MFGGAAVRRRSEDDLPRTDEEELDILGSKYSTITNSVRVYNVLRTFQEDFDKRGKTDVGKSIKQLLIKYLKDYATKSFDLKTEEDLQSVGLTINYSFFRMHTPPPMIINRRRVFAHATEIPINRYVMSSLDEAFEEEFLVSAQRTNRKVEIKKSRLQLRNADKLLAEKEFDLFEVFKPFINDILIDNLIRPAPVLHEPDLLKFIDEDYVDLRMMKEDVGQVLKGVVDKISYHQEQVQQVVENITQTAIENAAALKIGRAYRDKKLSKQLYSLAEDFRSLKRRIQENINDEEFGVLPNPEFYVQQSKLKIKAKKLLALVPLRSKALSVLEKKY